MSYQPYDRAAASPTDRVAWALCQIIDDDAPLRWTRYRMAAECIAKNPEVMGDLRAIRPAPPIDTGNLISDPLYLALDALYDKGWTDRHQDRKHDARGTQAWQDVLDLFRAAITDSAEQMQFMREDWKRVGDALGFDRHADPEDVLPAIAKLVATPAAIAELIEAAGARPVMDGRGWHIEGRTGKRYTEVGSFPNAVLAEDECRRIVRGALAAIPAAPQ